MSLDLLKTDRLQAHELENNEETIKISSLMT